MLNRKKTDPKNFIFTGVETEDTIDIQLFTYNKEECFENNNIQINNIPSFDDSKNNYWLNIHGISNAKSIAEICEKQGIHSLVIQDILDVNQRPKFQEFNNFSFLTLKSIVPSEKDIITEQISFVFGTNFLMSFQERKADFFSHLRHRLRENKGIVRERGADYLLYAMLESTLDNYFKTINKLEDEIEKLNFADTKKEPLPNSLAVIEDYKRFVNYIRKSILPIKEFTQIIERGDCNYIEKKHVKYFLEIKDLCLTLIDSCDMIHASLESATNLFFSVQGHRMNQVMKTLTVVATIFMPLTFIVGIYGMNFINMPELEWKYGYYGILVIMIVLFISMIYYFKLKKWF